MSLDSSTDTKLFLQLAPAGDLSSAKVKCEDISDEQISSSAFDDSALADEIKTMSLKDDPTDSPRDSDLVRLKDFFKNTKYTRGKPKGNSHTNTPPKYFVVLNQLDDSPVMAGIYCWLITSETISKIYRADPNDGQLEFCVDATKNFTIGSYEYVPDISNQALEELGPLGPHSVVFFDFAEAQQRYNFLTGQFHPSEGNARRGDLITDKSDYLDVNRSQVTPLDPQLTPAPQTGLSLQALSPAPTLSGQAYCSQTSSTMTLEVPRDARTSHGIEKYVHTFKEWYKDQGDRSLKLFCSHCVESCKGKRGGKGKEKRQGELSDNRPSTLIRHFRAHFNIKEFGCKFCPHQSTTKQQRNRHQVAAHKGNSLNSTELPTC